MRLHRSHVGILEDLTADALSVDASDKVEVIALIPVGYEVDAVVEETEVDTNIKLMLLLVGKLSVGKLLKDEGLLISERILLPWT